MNWYKKAQAIWQIPKDEYLAESKKEIRLLNDKSNELEKTLNKEEWNKWIEENAISIAKKRDQLIDYWNSEVKKAISLGKISIEEAKKIGYYSNGHETGYSGWVTLPHILYHVTTSKSKILKDKLKSRLELNMQDGAGLGGGENDTISFTEDIQIARNIKRCIIELKSVAQKEITIQDMIDMSKKGTDAKRTYYDQFMKKSDSYYGKGIFNFFEQGLMVGNGNLIQGEKAPPDKKYQWTKLENSWNTWTRPLSEYEKIDIAVNLYKSFLHAREQAGGPENPLFFSIDVKSYTTLPTEEIAILECKIKPGSLGYRVGGLGEWRTGSGDVVESIREVT